MDAKTGIGFLKLLLQQNLIHADDLEKAIRIASENSPSGAFRAAGIYFVGRHGDALENGYLAFQKGTRWLAMIRRDEGDATYSKVVAELRQAIGISKEEVAMWRGVVRDGVERYNPIIKFSPKDFSSREEALMWAKTNAIVGDIATAVPVEELDRIWGELEVLFEKMREETYY